ncbi:MAG TPA: hypothetical protein VMB70_13460 [Terriglobia bacterium]|jgi:hypothetical protein|nr:hypothetical protein [Terriglobia bacterium]
MDPIKRPTKAAIEAALSAYYSEVDEAARKNTLPEHQKVFDEIVMDSEDLQGVIIGISAALTMSPFEDAPTENLLKKAQDLVAAGQLDEDLLQEMNAAMGMFFWIGWHARGATEDSDDMLRMME